MTERKNRPNLSREKQLIAKGDWKALDTLWGKDPLEELVEGEKISALDQKPLQAKPPVNFEAIQKPAPPTPRSTPDPKPAPLPESPSTPPKLRSRTAATIALVDEAILGVIYKPHRIRLTYAEIFDKILI